MAGTCTVPATDGSASPARVEGACGSPSSSPARRITGVR
jgi:hypothetical protein